MQKLPLEIKMKDPMVVTVRAFVQDGDRVKRSHDPSHFVTLRQLFDLFDAWRKTNAFGAVGYQRFSDILKGYTDMGKPLVTYKQHSVVWRGYQLGPVSHPSAAAPPARGCRASGSSPGGSRPAAPGAAAPPFCTRASRGSTPGSM